jgi:hypothetical protein
MKKKNKEEKNALVEIFKSTYDKKQGELVSVNQNQKQMKEEIESFLELLKENNI